MARIGGRGNIAAANSLRQRAIRDGARPSTVANAFILTVPARDGQPDFDLDVGIATGFQGRRYTAKLRQILESCVVALRELERSGWNHLRRGDGGIRQRQRSQTFASGGDTGHSNQAQHRTEKHGGFPKTWGHLARSLSNPTEILEQL